jgi:hypothetical protein
MLLAPLRAELVLSREEIDLICEGCKTS